MHKEFIIVQKGWEKTFIDESKDIVEACVIDNAEIIRSCGDISRNPFCLLIDTGKSHDVLIIIFFCCLNGSK